MSLPMIANPIAGKKFTGKTVKDREAAEASGWKYHGIFNQKIVYEKEGQIMLWSNIGEIGEIYK